MPLSLFQYTIVSYSLLLPVILNLFVWNNSLVASIFGGVFVFFQLLVWGQVFMPKRQPFTQLLFAALLFITSLTLLGSIQYYLWNLSAGAQAIVFLGLPLIGIFLLIKSPGKQSQLSFDQQFPSLRDSLPQLVLVGSYLVLLILLFTQVLRAQTTQAITSPWNVLSLNFWGLFFLATFIWLLSLWKIKHKLINYLLASLHLFFCYAIAVIVYKIGYGFDPFIHQEAQSLIADTGLVLPKTPYYIGQYALIVSLNKLLGLSLLWTDKLLVPLLAALGIPLFLSEWSHRTKNEQPITTSSFWLSLTYLIIPFSFFVSTTPQGLATLFFVFIILGSFPLLSYRTNTIPLWFLWIMGISSAVIHPLVGIPAIIFLTLLTHELYRTRIHSSLWVHRITLFFVVFIGSLVMPIVFYVNGKLSPQLGAIIKPLSAIKLADLLTWLPVRLFLSETQYRSFFYEFAYFIQENIWWFLTVIILIMAYWLVLRSRYSYLRVYGLSSIIFLFNAIILSSFIDFPGLIQYENQAYAGRLFHTAFLTASPLILLALIWLWRRIEHSKYEQILLAFCLSWLISGILFASYPRNNRYELGRQYSVSETDLRTVRKIGEKKTNFVVLANQSVSAAAIKEFGFLTYFKTDEQGSIFYYPIPTSSPLYEIYLKMVYDQPSREHAQEAVGLTGVDTVYFVLNNYWDNASQIKEQAKLQADEWLDIDNGTNTIFIYRF